MTGGGFGVKLRNFNVLQPHDGEELKLAVLLGGISRQDVGAGALKRGLQDGALALEVIILQKMVSVAGEVGEA